MCDRDVTIIEKLFSIDKPKRSRAICKICKRVCLTGEIRIAKNIPDASLGRKKFWHHVDCIFQQFLKQRLSTKRIESPDDMDGWENLNDIDKKMMENKLKRNRRDIGKRSGFKDLSKRIKKRKKPANKKKMIIYEYSDINTNSDILFEEYYNTAIALANANNESERSPIISKIFKEGMNVFDLKDDVLLWSKFLISNLDKRDYRIENKQLAKMFGELFNYDNTSLLKECELADISEVISEHFKENNKYKPAHMSTLLFVEIDEFLEKLTNSITEEDKIIHFKDVLIKCTVYDLKMLIRLIKNNLKVNIGTKQVLKHLHPDAYQFYQGTRNIEIVLDDYFNISDGTMYPASKTSVSPMTTIWPMQKGSCTDSAELILSIHIQGMYCQLNYEGEEVQLHKQDKEVAFHQYIFKSKLSEKLPNFKKLIDKAFPNTKDLIVDCEILPINPKTGKPTSPHLLEDYDNSEIYLLVIDCLYCDGDITSKSLKERKGILERHLVQIPNVIMLSEPKEIHRIDDLNEICAKMLSLKLDSLILKDINGVYESGKRQLLRVKLNNILDIFTSININLAVLGAWYDEESKTQMMPTFLMGCYDENRHCFCTVAKVYADHTLELLKAMNMVKINRDNSKVPSWLDCSKNMVPDYVAENPKTQPIWRIIGKALEIDHTYTADSITIKFPQVSKMEHDRDLKLIDLRALQILFENRTTDVVSVPKFKGKNKKVSHKPMNKREMQNYNESPLKKLKESEIIIETPQEEFSLSRSEKPLPKYFENVYLLQNDDVKGKYIQWIRDFVAYGGKLVDDRNKHHATHVLHLYDEVPNEQVGDLADAVHTIIEWIKDTLTKGPLDDDRPYRVQLISTEIPASDMLE